MSFYDGRTIRTITLSLLISLYSQLFNYGTTDHDPIGSRAAQVQVDVIVPTHVRLHIPYTRAMAAERSIITPPHPANS